MKQVQEDSGYILHHYRNSANMKCATKAQDNCAQANTTVKKTTQKCSRIKVEISEVINQITIEPTERCNSKQTAMDLWTEQVHIS